MWIYHSVLCVALVCGLTLDSNTIRTSRESTLHSSELQRRGCSNRAQKTPSNTDRYLDQNQNLDSDGLNRTKAPEMSSCVRSGDCAAGLCCARYLTGKRCQRIPVEGEACLLRRALKRSRRNLDRCDCDTGLSCAPTGPAEPGRKKRQGVCVARPRQAQRKTRHSGKKRRTAERTC
ncbi:dickkopf-related protein 2 [Austrofundulus limnaeus]|uniref:Dickkopf-related protein 2 n=1 Tax=Austrofundulus limnaeus TaxID=52670 RepID=A0A2I4CE29_AUSLI|nr:PREDICTED: dickkopf-related protein 2-like [Austrofundulus limnaeus]